MILWKRGSNVLSKTVFLFCFIIIVLLLFIIIYYVEVHEIWRKIWKMKKQRCCKNKQNFTTRKTLKRVFRFERDWKQQVKK